MTTIAVDLRSGRMASDSRVTSDDCYYDTDKIFECADGSLVGFAGVVGDALNFVEWLTSGADPKKRPSFTENTFKAIVLNGDGMSVWDMSCRRFALKGRDFYGIGSGGLAAMGAMYAGADLAHAVKIATLCDECSGGEIVVKQYVAKTAVKRKRKPKAAAPVKESGDASASES